MLGFSLLAASGATLHCVIRASHCGSLSRGAEALRLQTSAVAVRGLSSCVSWALERWLSICGAGFITPGREASS